MAPCSGLIPITRGIPIKPTLPKTNAAWMSLFSGQAEEFRQERENDDQRYVHGR